MNKSVMAAVFAVGLAVVGWVAWGFVGASPLALVMTGLIGGVYLLGAWELWQFRAATASLATALRDTAQPPSDLAGWLERLAPALRAPVRQRIEGERAAFAGPALTPYLVGLLVMLGMLGTFLGMVVTFKGTVSAMEVSSSLESIRAALADPIKGLGLAFGTSVAGVAASAMLGLLSALCRRERLDALRLLDARVATAFRPFSAAQRRDDTFAALQAQAQSMPLIAERLLTLMDGLERRNEALSDQLRAQQDTFHRETVSVYTQLASAVGVSLHDSLGASARLAGDVVRPVVEAAMTTLMQEAQQSHQRLDAATQLHMQTLSAQWEHTAHRVAETWTEALQTHQQTQGALTTQLDETLQSVVSALDQRSTGWLASLQDTVAQSHALQATADQERLSGWSQSMQAMASTLAAQWQSVGAQTAAQQQAVCRTLEDAASQLTEQAGEQLRQAVRGAVELLDQSQGLLDARMQAEARSLQGHAQQMDALASVWRTELGTLRNDEAARGLAAVERLDALQAAVAEHLAHLGAALEAPLNRLLHTAAEVPQAAAGVITQLRQEMAVLSERDNAALAERTTMMAQLGDLLHSVNDAALEQRAAIESLVVSAASVLEQAGQQFSQSLGAQAGQAEKVATHVAASAVELSSLGESFGYGVAQFTASNDKLMHNLQRIEGALGQSLSRSDEQLAYYVAQAREVIDLSISAQQGIVQDLRRLNDQAASAARGVAA